MAVVGTPGAATVTAAGLPGGGGKSDVDAGVIGVLGGIDPPEED